MQNYLLLFFQLTESCSYPHVLACNKAHNKPKLENYSEVTKQVRLLIVRYEGERACLLINRGSLLTFF